MNADLSESADFWPTYATWNSVLFETSVILTLWQHAEQLLGVDSIAILHSDVVIHGNPTRAWECVQRHLDEFPNVAVGLTAPCVYKPMWKSLMVPESFALDPAHDPMVSYRFDRSVHVWDLIHKYDPELYSWAQREQPRIIYAHQFACTRKTFDALGSYLHRITSRILLKDTGLWTPHVFERLIGLFLVRHGGRGIHTSAFWHYQSSGKPQSGGDTLYGHRPIRYYKPMSD